jgi:hypothetical protein
MTQSTTQTVDIAYWRQYVEKALSERLAHASIESQPASGLGPNEVHTAFRIEDKSIRDKTVDQLFMQPAADALIADLQKVGSKRVAVMIDVQDVAGCPGIAIRLFPQDRSVPGPDEIRRRAAG